MYSYYRLIHYLGTHLIDIWVDIGVRQDAVRVGMNMVPHSHQHPHTNKTVILDSIDEAVDLIYQLIGWLIVSSLMDLVVDGPSIGATNVHIIPEGCDEVPVHYTGGGPWEWLWTPVSICLVEGEYAIVCDLGMKKIATYRHQYTSDDLCIFLSLQNRDKIQKRRCMG